jgi:DNA-directed RNA polymerase subunit RPC12/RpoP
MGSDPFDDFFTDPVELVAAKGKPAVEYKCGQCGGTGRWSGGRNQYGNSDCHACKVKGFFKTSPKFRADTREKTATKKTDLLAAGIADFQAEYPESYSAMQKAFDDMQHDRYADNFFVSLYGSLHKYGSLTPNQLGAMHRALVRKTEKDAAYQQSKVIRDEAALAVDLSSIKEMFDKAVANGYKRPAYRAEGLIINRAPDSGSNPGALYVKGADGTYFGKVTDLKFLGVRAATEAGVDAKLLTIAADPKAAAVAYGRQTGVCSCCGRTLTDPVSIALGIGPICAERWF